MARAEGLDTALPGQMERAGCSKRRRSLGFRAESQPAGAHPGRSFANWNIGMFQMRLGAPFERRIAARLPRSNVAAALSSLDGNEN
jgi:hypothetical protein